MNGTFYFTADNGFSGHELWKSDGTSAGTSLVKSFGTGMEVSGETAAVLNNTLFFVRTSHFAS